MADLTGKTLITEEDIRGAGFGATLRIGERALVTALAADLARERHIQLERVAASPSRRKIAIGADLIQSQILAQTMTAAIKMSVG